MKKHLILFLAAISMTFFVGCDYEDDIDPPNYVTFESNSPANVGVEIDGSSTHEVTVYTANVVNNDRTFDLLINDATTLDPAGYDVPGTITIPAGTNEATFTVGVSDVNLGIGGKKVVLDLERERGLSTGDPIVLNVSRTCVGTEFTIDFVFDGYASETDWTLEDADGNVVVDGGGYKDGTGSLSLSYCLDLGTYTFNVTDAFGDGLTYPDEGSITLSYAGEELEVIPGDFGAETSATFTLD